MLERLITLFTGTPSDISNTEQTIEEVIDGKVKRYCSICDDVTWELWAEAKYFEERGKKAVCWKCVDRFNIPIASIPFD